MTSFDKQLQILTDTGGDNEGKGEQKERGSETKCGIPIAEEQGTADLSQQVKIEIPHTDVGDRQTEVAEDPTLEVEERAKAKSHKSEVESTVPKKVKWFHVIRDVIILTVFIFIGGAIAGLASAPRLPSPIAMYVGTLLMTTLGFLLCGYLTTENKWKHLFVVAVLFWLTNYLPSLLLKPFNVIAWALTIAPVFVALLVGGGLSSVIGTTKNRRNPSFRKYS
jgi:hypothetical protein